jgi:outer membrane protein assembly factor BamD
VITENKNNYFLSCLLIIFFLTGCATQKTKNLKEGSSNINAEAIYQEAANHYQSKNYKIAKQKFESVKSIYPYSSLAESSIEKLIKINEEDGKYDEAILNIEELLTNYGANIDIEEFRYKHSIVYYLKLQKQLRDQSLMDKTSVIMSAFLEDFPNSKHIDEIKEKLSIVNGRLVYREMEIGYFYEIQRNFLASLKRYLIAYHFSKNNSYRDEILYRISYCYWMIGLKEEGQKYYDELELEFPKSELLKLARKIYQL